MSALKGRTTKLYIASEPIVNKNASKRGISNESKRPKANTSPIGNINYLASFEPVMNQDNRNRQKNRPYSEAISRFKFVDSDGLEEAPKEVLTLYLDRQLGEICSLISSLENLERGLNNNTVIAQERSSTSCDQINGNLSSTSHTESPVPKGHGGLFRPISHGDSLDISNRVMGKEFQSLAEWRSPVNSSDEDGDMKSRGEKLVSIYAYSSEDEGSVQSDSCPSSPEENILQWDDLVMALNRLAGVPEKTGLVNLSKFQDDFYSAQARASPSSFEACLKSQMMDFRTSGLIMKMEALNGNGNNLLAVSQENMELELQPKVLQNTCLETGSGRLYDDTAPMHMGPMLIKKVQDADYNVTLSQSILNSIQEKHSSNTDESDFDSVISVMGSISSSSSSSLTSGVGDTSLSSPEEEMMVFEEAKEMGFTGPWTLKDGGDRRCSGKSCRDRSCTCRLSLTDEGIMSIASSQDLSSCRSQLGSLERPGLYRSSSSSTGFRSLKRTKTFSDAVEDGMTKLTKSEQNMRLPTTEYQGVLDHTEGSFHHRPSLTDTQEVFECPQARNRILGPTGAICESPTGPRPQALGQEHPSLAPEMAEAEETESAKEAQPTTLPTLQDNQEADGGQTTLKPLVGEKMKTDMDAEDKARLKGTVSPPWPKTGVVPPGRSTPIPSCPGHGSGKNTLTSELTKGSNQEKASSEGRVSIPAGRLTALPPSGPRAVTSSMSRKPSPAMPGITTNNTRTSFVPALSEPKVSSSNKAVVVELNPKQGVASRTGVVPPNRGPSGVWCELCNKRLGELRRQGRLLLQQASAKGPSPLKDPHLLASIEDQLELPEPLRPNLRHDQCTTCHTLVAELRREALAMVQSLDRGTATEPPPNMAATYQHTGQQRAPQSGIPMFMGSRSLTPMPRTTPHYSLAHHRLARQGIPRGQPSGASAVKAHGDQKQHAWAASRKHYNQMLVSSPMMSAGLVRSSSPSMGMESPSHGRGDFTGGGTVGLNGGMPNGSMQSPSRPMALAVSTQHHSPGGSTPTGVLSPGSTGSGGSGASAAASFFARQKLQAQHKRNRDRAASNRKIKDLEKAVEKHKRLAERYKKRCQRMRNKCQDAELTPRSKSKKLLRVMGHASNQVKKILTFHYSLLADLKEKYHKTKTQRDKRRFKALISGKCVKKYRFLTKGRECLGLGRNWAKKYTPPSKSAAGSLVECLKTFYERDDVSRSTTGKKETVTRQKVKKQKRFLTDTMKTLHKKFLADHPQRNISYSLFCKLRPFWVLIPRTSDRDTCKCKLHDNLEFMSNKLHQLKLVSNASVEEMAESVACDPANKECMYDECITCKGREVSVNNPVDPKQSTFWWQWKTKKEEKEKKKIGQNELTKFTVQVTVKEKIEGTVEQLISTFQDQMKKTKKHVFNIRNQYRVYRHLRQSMQPHECLIHIDFAENYLCKYGSEIQAVHFGSSHKQASLHTGVMYLGGGTELQTFCTISNATDHCPEAIWAHVDPVLNDLREEHSQITTVHFFSDGPTSQYRQKKNFLLFSTELHRRGFKLGTWNFFESSHGKGAPDGVGGALKRSADRLVAEGKDVSHPVTLFQELSKTSSIRLYFVPEDKVQNAISEFGQAHPNLKSIPGNNCIHQLITKSYGDLLYRDVSCVCSPQEYYACECYHPKPFSYRGAADTLPVEVINLEVADLVDIDEESIPQAPAPGTLGTVVLRSISLWSPDLIGKHCIVEYQGEAYPGKIIYATDEDVQVECMQSAGKNRFSWPARKDICWYPFQKVITLIDDIIPVSRRHCQIEPEIWAKVEEYLGK